MWTGKGATQPAPWRQAGTLISLQIQETPPLLILILILILNGSAETRHRISRTSSMAETWTKTTT